MKHRVPSTEYRAPGRSIRISTLTILWFGIAAWPVVAQDAGKPFGQGTHALRGIIRSPKPIPGYEKRFELTPIKAYEQIDPANTLVIILGDPNPLLKVQQQTGGLQRFVQRGGALLVASDHRIHQPLGFEFQVEVAGGYYQSVGGEVFAGLEDCPLVRDLAREPIFRRVEAIATNRPSALALYPSSPLQTYAWLSVRQDGRGRARLNRLPFIAGGQLGRGRVLILADHSVFINDMMLQADTDNFDFAYNCIDWLTESGQRQQVLMIEDGQIVTNFNVSFKPPAMPPLPSQEKIVEQVNNLLVEADAEDLFNAMLLRAFGNSPSVAHTRLLRAVLLLATLGLALYGLLRLMGARHRIDKATPLLATVTATAAADQPILEQRRQALQELGNCAELARARARHCLEKAGCTRWDRLPRFTVQGQVWERWAAGRKLRRLWRVATAVRTPRIRPGQLAAFIALTEEMQAAFADGRIRLATEVAREA